MAQRLSRHWTLVVLSLLMAGLMVGLMASTTQTTMGQEHDQAVAFSGQAQVVDATVLGIDVDLVKAGPLPAAGGSDEEDLPQSNIPGLLTAEALHAETVGAGSQSRSEASVLNLKLIVGGHIVEASVLKAVATATCPGPKVTGESEIVGLKIDGKEIAVPAGPNTRIDLNPALGSYVILNEQKSKVSGNFAEITVNALHVVVPHMADVIISSAYADIKCKVPPPPPPPDGKIEAKLDKLEGKADRLEGKADKIEGKLDKVDKRHLETQIAMDEQSPKTQGGDFVFFVHTHFNGVRNDADVVTVCIGSTCTPPPGPVTSVTSGVKQVIIPKGNIPPGKSTSLVVDVVGSAGTPCSGCPGTDIDMVQRGNP